MRKSSDMLSALFKSIRDEKVRRESKAGGRTNQVAGLLSFMRAHQRALEADPSPLISVLSARQQGKSTGALLLAAVRCLQVSGAQWAVIGITRASVQRIYWDTLRNLSEAFELKVKFHEQRLVASFPNGSRIHFFGADKIDEIEKLRGSRFHGAVVDECKSYPFVTLKLLVEDILGPCLKLQAGQLYLIGTPGDVLTGEFYLATCPDPVLLSPQNRWSNLPAGEKTRPGPSGEAVGAVWSLHRWGPRTNDVTFENDRTHERFTTWDAFLGEKERRGWSDDHPTWRREYLGTWVPGDGRLVYRYRPHLHDYTPGGTNLWGLPTETTGWRTACGVDFGTRDGTAIVVWAWHPHVRGLWELYSEKRKSEGPLVAVSAIAAWFRAVEDEYGPFDGAVGDPSGLATMVLDTLAVEHKVHIDRAEKKEKLDHIEMFNDDLDAGLIHLRHGSELAEEMLGNKWLERTLGTPNRKEDPSTPNDLCDAALYAFRWCAHRSFRPPAPAGPAMFSREWYANLAADELAKAEAAARRGREPGQLDAEWWNN